MSVTKTLPLRTALIGLSASATTSWAAVAHFPALQTTTGKSKFTITALLNSSVSAAEAAINAFKLPPTTKAYGSPEDLAADIDIDLVICNTRVDKHFETILPSIKAGKDVYVEWPIASNTADISTLVSEAKKSGSRVAVGLQSRWAPAVVKLREILQNGKLGKVLSSDVRIFGGTNDRGIMPIGLKYFAQREVGGNVVVINFGHVFDFVLSVLGDLDPGTVSTKLQLQRPEVRIRDPKIGDVVETVTSDVPDLLSLHGALLPSPIAQEDATLSMVFRRGQPFPGSPPFTWSINCEFGEVRLVAIAGTALHAEAESERVKIQVHHFDTDEVEDVVGWVWSKEQEEVPTVGRSVLRSLYSFADFLGGAGKEEEGWVELEDAARRANLIESFLEGWAKGQN